MLLMLNSKNKLGNKIKHQNTNIQNRNHWQGSNLSNLELHNVVITVRFVVLIVLKLSFSAIWTDE